MSSGHHHSYVHRSDLVAEVEKLLRDPAVLDYLHRGYRVDSAYPVPLTGGSSKDGLTYFVNPDLPMSDRPFVIWHERVEKALRAVRGMSYARAHELATCAERMLVEAKGLDWGVYKARVAHVVRINEHRPVRPPENFDIGPYQESGMMHLLGAA